MLKLNEYASSNNACVNSVSVGEKRDLAIHRETDSLNYNVDELKGCLDELLKRLDPVLARQNLSEKKCEVIKKEYSCALSEVLGEQSQRILDMIELIRSTTLLLEI